MEIISTIDLGVYLMLYICSVKTGIPTVIKLFFQLLANEKQSNTM